MTPLAHAQFAAALAAFEAQAFFECHDLLEPLWQAEIGEMRLFYQGIIQVAAAFVHWQRGEMTGIVTLLRTALDKLTRFPDAVGGIDLARFRQETDAALTYFERADARVEGFTADRLPKLVAVSRPVGK